MPADIYVLLSYLRYAPWWIDVAWLLPLLYDQMAPGGGGRDLRFLADGTRYPEELLTCKLRYFLKLKN